MPMIQDVKEGMECKYTEMCQTLEQPIKRSDSRKAQMEAWKRAFDFEMITSQRLRVTKIIDLNTDISVKHGGSRENSGRKSKLQSEFDALFNMFLHYNFNKNVYKGQPNLCDVHATTAYMQRYFGIYSYDFYKARDNPDVDQDILFEVSSKCREKFNSLILNKIDNRDDIKYGHGIIAYETLDRDSQFVYRDDWLEEYDAHIEEYKAKNHTNIQKIIKSGHWNDLVEYCSSFFQGYKKVIKTHRFVFDVRVMHDFEIEDYEQLRHAFNRTIVSDLIKFFKKKYGDEKAQPYIDIILHYVAI